MLFEDKVKNGFFWDILILFCFKMFFMKFKLQCVIFNG